MPTHSCTKGGKPGKQWGDQKCYTGEGAEAKADKQGRAIKASQARKGLIYGAKK